MEWSIDGQEAIIGVIVVVILSVLIVLGSKLIDHKYKEEDELLEDINWNNLEFLWKQYEPEVEPQDYLECDINSNLKEDDMYECTGDSYLSCDKIKINNDCMVTEGCFWEPKEIYKETCMCTCLSEEGGIDSITSIDGNSEICKSKTNCSVGVGDTYEGTNDIKFGPKYSYYLSEDNRECPEGDEITSYAVCEFASEYLTKGENISSFDTWGSDITAGSPNHSPWCSVRVVDKKGTIYFNRYSTASISRSAVSVCVSSDF